MKVQFEKEGKICTFDISGQTLSDDQILHLWKSAIQAIEKKTKESKHEQDPQRRLAPAGRCAGIPQQLRRDF